MMTMRVNGCMRTLTSHQMSLVKSLVTTKSLTSSRSRTRSSSSSRSLWWTKFQQSRSRGFVKRSSSENQRRFKTKLFNSKKTLRIQKTFIPFFPKKRTSIQSSMDHDFQRYSSSTTQQSQLSSLDQKDSWLGLDSFLFVELLKSQGIMNRVLDKIQHK